MVNVVISGLAIVHLIGFLLQQDSYSKNVCSVHGFLSFTVICSVVYVQIVHLFYLTHACMCIYNWKLAMFIVIIISLS